MRFSLLFASNPGGTGRQLSDVVFTRAEIAPSTDKRPNETETWNLPAGRGADATAQP